MGIHNEPGVEKIKLPMSKDLIASMLTYITDTQDAERAYVPFQHDSKDEIILLINNLGGMSELEMTSIANDAALYLEENHISIKRILAGSFMTSLNLPGFSLTTLLLPRDGDKYPARRIIELFDAKASAPGWKFHVNGAPGVPEPAGTDLVPATMQSGGAPVSRRSTSGTKSLHQIALRCFCYRS